ncbi:MAG: RDD family protein [Planctomycetes bacterium]|nr:RDD family protein [Planctomycetota bacterium]
MPNAQGELHAAAVGDVTYLTRVPLSRSGFGVRRGTGFGGGGTGAETSGERRLLSLEGTRLVGDRWVPAFSEPTPYGPRLLSLTEGRLRALVGPDDVATPESVPAEGSVLREGGGRLWLARDAQGGGVEVLCWDGSAWGGAEAVAFSTDVATDRPSCRQGADLVWWRDRLWLFWKGANFLFYAARTAPGAWTAPECVAVEPEEFQVVADEARLVLAFQGQATLAPLLPTRVHVAVFDGTAWRDAGATPRAPFGVFTRFQAVPGHGGPVLWTDDGYGVRRREVRDGRLGPPESVRELDYMSNVTRVGLWVGPPGLLIALLLLAAIAPFLDRWKGRTLPPPHESVRVAGLFARCLAQVVDGGIFWLGSLLLFSVLLAQRPDEEGGWMTVQSSFATLTGLGMFVLYFVYLFVTEACWGTTLGKRLLGLTVVDLELHRAGWGRIFLRTLLRLVDTAFFGYLAGAIAIAATRRWQRLGDLMAGTLVVERGTMQGN